MNEEIKKEWVAALRSGEYEQGREYLNTKGKYCCLGVLCEIAIKHGLDLPIRTRRTYSNISVIAYDQIEHVLPAKVQKWAGLGSESPSVQFNGCNTALAEMNDEGMSFERIADIIEEKL